MDSNDQVRMRDANAKVVNFVIEPGKGPMVLAKLTRLHRVSRTSHGRCRDRASLDFGLPLGQRHKGLELPA